MSIKLLARDLYRSQCEIDRLENDFATAAGDAKTTISEALRRARAEKERLKRALDGQIGR